MDGFRYIRFVAIRFWAEAETVQCPGYSVNIAIVCLTEIFVNLSNSASRGKENIYLTSNGVPERGKGCLIQ